MESTPFESGSAIKQEIVRVQYGIDDFRILIETPANGGGNGLSCLPAKPRLLRKLNAKAAHCAHFVSAGRDLKDDA